ncbi:MAG: alpha/beta hydrolase [Candidatus Peregrinibacteria bacterium]
MSNIFIIHGAEGNPEENWFPWLKRKLEMLGHRVFVPQFPTPEGQNLENWLNVLQRYKKDFDKNAIVVGHSLGVLFLLNLLEHHLAKGAFFVAGFDRLPGNRFDDGMKTFAAHDFDWKKIRAHCQSFHVFHSDNDPYVRLETAKKLAFHLGTEVILMKGAGHFNAATGYTSFEALLKQIKEVL